MKKILIILFIVDVILFGLTKFDVKTPTLSFYKKYIVQSSAPHSAQQTTTSKTSKNENTHNKTSNRVSDNVPASGSQFSGSGRVTKVLSDDNKGSRHQRFILELPSGRTVLVAHNIDLAPRVSSLHVGDTISFNGVYEYNSKGGVVHWTHHDPDGRHAAGWLRKNGQTYQ